MLNGRSFLSGVPHLKIPPRSRKNYENIIIFMKNME